MPDQEGDHHRFLSLKRFWIQCAFAILLIGLILFWVFSVGGIASDIGESGINSKNLGENLIPHLSVVNLPML